MAIYKPQELLAFLESLGIRPKKGLSQNFLIDGNIIRKIVSYAKVEAGDVVIEIGPGPGSLTEGLLQAGAKVIAIEKDQVLASALSRFQTTDHALDIIAADILDCSIEKILKEHLRNGRKAKVIANLPYHITTPIVTRLVPLHLLISHIVIMVQDEVAKRFVGQPCTPSYGSLTVYLKYYSQPKYLFKVSKNSFYPSPTVDSAVVELLLREPPSVSNEDKFFEMTRRAFEQRRKMLRVSLKEQYHPSQIQSALVNMGKNPQSRPEELSLEEFMALFALLN